MNLGIWGFVCEGYVFVEDILTWNAMECFMYLYRQASVASIQPVEHAQSKVVNIDLKVYT